MLWVDEARPKKLKELDLHHDVNNILMRLAGTSDFPHLLFYGPPGSGRKTRIMAFLHDIFGAGVGKLKSDMKQFTVNKTDVEICVCFFCPSHSDALIELPLRVQPFRRWCP